MPVNISDKFLNALNGNIDVGRQEIDYEQNTDQQTQTFKLKNVQFIIFIMIYWLKSNPTTAKLPVESHKFSELIEKVSYGICTIIHLFPNYDDSKAYQKKPQKSIEIWAHQENKLHLSG